MVNSELQQYNENYLKLRLELESRYQPYRYICYITRRRRHFRNKRIPKHISNPYLDLEIFIGEIKQLMLTRPRVDIRNNILTISQRGIKIDVDKNEIQHALEVEAEKLFPEYKNNIHIIL